MGLSSLNGQAMVPDLCQVEPAFVGRQAQSRPTWRIGIKDFSTALQVTSPSIFQKYDIGKQSLLRLNTRYLV